jgi:hypothetical protein
MRSALHQQLHDEQGHDLIYALIDPRTGKAHYIGRTANVQARRTNHQDISSKSGNPAKRAWVAELRKAGLRPELKVLTGSNDHREAIRLENEYIRRYAAEGHPLTNVIR